MNESGPRHLHPGTIIVGFIKALPRQIIAAIALAAFLSKFGFVTATLIFLAIVAIVIAFRALAWWRFTYNVLPDELTIQSGVFSRNKRSIPWDRVQDVDIERDMFARVFGWAKVKLETGGAGQDEGGLDSIAIKDAEALRALVRSRRSGALIASATDEEATEPKPVIAFAMPPRRLLQAGLFNFSLLWLAILYGIGHQIDRALPYDWDDLLRWLGLNENRIFGLLNPVLIGSAFGLFLILGVLSGIAQMVVTNFGFRLSVEGNGLRRVRGLFTRTEIIIPRKRVQVVIVTRNWLARRFGFARIAVQTMAALGRRAGGKQDLAPLANGAETSHVLTLAGNFNEPQLAEFQPVAPAHVWIGVIMLTLFPALIILGNALFKPMLLWLMLLVPLSGGLAWLTRRPHAWVITEAVLAIRRGWFGQDHILIPLRNIQSLRLTSGPIQRRAGLASILIDTAGASPQGHSLSNLPHETARQVLNDLRASR